MPARFTSDGGSAEAHSEKRLVGYASVSTYGQTLDSQLEQLRAAVCGSRNIYREKTTGARVDRRKLNRVLGSLAPGDVVLVAGSSVFPYYPYLPGPLLPEGASLVALTADPAEAARAPSREISHPITQFSCFMIRGGLVPERRQSRRL